MYGHELALILYPVFVHMYLELVYNHHEEEAKQLIGRFGPVQENNYQENISGLSIDQRILEYQIIDQRIL